MGSRNVWILLVFVLLLGGAALWQVGREQSHTFDVDQPLFDGLRPERVQSVRIDHLERGLQITMQRDADGSWQITDPLEYPAEGGVLDRLLEAVSKNRALPVEKPDLAGMSLAPPRAVLELVEALPGGQRKLRLELGAKDLDGKYVYARVEGQVVRTLRNLDSTLERDLSDWRQHRVSNVAPASVVELRRTGKVDLDPALGPVDMKFEATVTATGWRVTSPWNAAADPSALGALLSNACYMQARTFLADSAAQVPAFGLDQPDLRLEMVLADGSRETLLFKHEPLTESWTCMRENSTHVFKVDNSSLVFLSMPSEGFLDPQLVRAARDDLQRIELRHGTRRIELRRDGAIWWLGTQPAAGAMREAPADSEAVLDLAGAILEARVARYLVEEDLTAFAPDEPPLGLTVFTSAGEFALEFGAAHSTGDGVKGRLFRRAGEDVVGLVEGNVAALAERDWSALVDRQMLKLPEKAIAAIELTHGEFKRRFARDAATGRWSPEGADAEAPKSFQKCIERLLSLRADVAVDPAADFSLEDVWQVVVIDGGDVRTTYHLGKLASDPTQQGFDDGRVRGIVSSSGLWADLGQIP